MDIIGAIRREYIQTTSLLRTLRRVSRVKPNSPCTIADVVERWAREKAGNTAIYFENRSYTYRAFDQAANQYARWALAQGIKRGQAVALFMENRPEYLFAWLGLAKIGAVAALINSNLRGSALAHSLNTSRADHVILGAELEQSFASAKSELDHALSVWTTGGVVDDTHDLDVELSCHSPEPVGAEHRDGMVANDLCFYVYTSGTTGLPKAARISHLRVFNIMNVFSASARATDKDRMYVVLPLYHTSGGIAAVGTTLAVGGSIVLRRRFSAHQFWQDVSRYEVTLFQYIGELCRYLLNSPPDPLEREHKVRCVIGNGLRPEIWTRFVDRFAIPRVIEFYGSTEGNVTLINYDGTVGAVGRIPRYLEHILQVKIIRFDVETGTPILGGDGLCIEAGPDEIGEAIGRINEKPDSALGRFEGYMDKSSTDSKILRDAFEPGDAWFRTGDLMRKDRLGYFYFVDRIGDTFRWKGENVATSEVAEAISEYPGVREVNVYGVKVPGTEGRAGMAAIVSDESIDLNGLHHHLDNHLAPYARPIFIRLRTTIDATETFKHRKIELVEEGFSPQRIKEPLYFDHPKLRGYVPLTERLHHELVSGQIKL